MQNRKIFLAVNALWLGTVFVSATLLFNIQPLISKSLLPYLGGSPAVWNTAMVFFQFLLLLGYLYAHLLTQLRTLPRQLLLHFALCLLTLVFLPVGLPDNWLESSPTISDAPISWLLLSLSVSVGGVFFILASSGPLLQRWLSNTLHPWAKDPYLLFVASNAGSFVGLLGYPLLIEPLFTLAEQKNLWSILYISFVVLVIGCGAFVFFNLTPDKKGATSGPRLSRKKIYLCLAFAFVPSSLMLGVTQYLATDIGSFPLLWVVPLAIYLLSFIVGFTKAYHAHWHANLVKYLPVTAVLALLAFVLGFRGHIVLQTCLHVIALFHICLVMHGELSRLRPQALDLTKYYLLISAGGVAGGIFNSFLAPLLFNNIVEYPLVLVLAVLILSTQAGEKIRIHKVALPALAFVLLFWLLPALIDKMEPRGKMLGVQWSTLIYYGALTGICLAFIKELWLFTFSLAVFVGIWFTNATFLDSHILYQKRTFFGVHKVVSYKDGSGDWHSLWHGSTLHGIQYSQAPWSLAPTSYYTDSGPMGDIMHMTGWGGEDKKIAFVGLGAGTLAAYGQKQYEFDFFEIDPEVIRIAQDQKFFTYLNSSQAKRIDFKLGDARLQMQQQPDKTYDLIVLDAFSSDAIPTHLITQEAIALYTRKLKPGGQLALHITNIYLDLSSVLSRISDFHNLKAYMCDDENISQDDDILRQKKYSRWVVFFLDESMPARFAGRLSRWRVLPKQNFTSLWTDDYVSILGVIR